MDKSLNYKSTKKMDKMEKKDLEIETLRMASIKSYDMMFKEAHKYLDENIKLKEQIKMMDDYIKEQQETINTFPQMTIMKELKEENKNLKEQIEKLQTNLKRANKVIDQIEKVILISNKEWRVGLADADDD